MKQKSNQSLIPTLRFPEFRDAEGWDATILGQLSEVVRGGSPRPIDGFITTSADDLNWLKIGDVDKEAKYVTRTAEKVRREALSKTRVVSPGDLILSNSMSFGRPYILQIKTCIHDGWIAITSIAEETERDFLYYQISAPSSQNYFMDNAAGSGVLNLNAEIIKALPICFPQTPEQQKIADCLSSLDELIAAQARKVDVLKTHKKGLMQELFPHEGETQPRLRFPEFQNAGEWEVRKAGSLFTNRITKGEQCLPIYSVTMHDGMVRRDSFDRNFYDIENAAGNKKVCRNDIAYNMMRMWQGALGVAPEDCLVSPAYIVLAPMNDAVPEFFQYMFKLPTTLFLLTSHSRGLTKDRLRLYYDDFSRIPLRCPAPLEQRRIASCLSSLDDLIAAQTQKLAAIKTHKKGLMQQLFPAAEEAGA